MLAAPRAASAWPSDSRSPPRPGFRAALLAFRFLVVKSGRPRVARLVHKADFEVLLSSPVVARSTHFALHLAPFDPTGLPTPRPAATPTMLSTDDEPIGNTPVDNLGGSCALGCLLPKRHARRAVTRNLLRREIKQAFEDRVGEMSPGRYLVRLRAAPPTRLFPAAASRALRVQVRTELSGMIDRLSRSGGVL